MRTYARGQSPESIWGCADQVMWWKTGVIPPLGTYKSYWLDPFSLFWIEVILVQFAELKR